MTAGVGKPALTISFKAMDPKVTNSYGLDSSLELHIQVCFCTVSNRLTDKENACSKPCRAIYRATWCWSVDISQHHSLVIRIFE
jgi:hypothetical protein